MSYEGLLLRYNRAASFRYKGAARYSAARLRLQVRLSILFILRIRDGVTIRLPDRPIDLRKDDHVDIVLDVFLPRTVSRG